MRVLIYGDAPTIGSGYGVVAKYLGKALIKKGVNVDWMALQYGTGAEIPYEGGRIFAGDPYSFDYGMRKARPDILLHIRDNWVFTPDFYPQAYSFKKAWDIHKFKQVNYTPVQALPLPASFIKSITDEAHLTITMTKWAMNGVIRQGVPESRIDYLYHGVDRKVFKNMTTEEDNKTKRFIFVGANYDYRKNIPFLMKAFKLYKDKSNDIDSQLYIHANVRGFFALDTFLNVLEFKPNDVLFKEEQAVRNFGTGVNETKLVDLYNWANVYATATISEGFNIPVLEALSIGLPVILTDFPVHRELFSRFNRVYFVKSQQNFPTVWGFEWLADMDEFVEKMMKVPAGKIVRYDEEFKEFNWDNIAERFLKIINEKLKI